MSGTLRTAEVTFDLERDLSEFLLSFRVEGARAALGAALRRLATRST